MGGALAILKQITFRECTIPFSCFLGDLPSPHQQQTQHVDHDQTHLTPKL